MSEGDAKVARVHHRRQVAAVRAPSTKATAQRLLLSWKQSWMLKLSRRSDSSSVPVTPPKPPPCFICLEDMHPVDVQHPIPCQPCQTKNNFCGVCLDTLMFKDDGTGISTHIKCPYCRFDLSKTICDTALLRKVDRRCEPTQFVSTDPALAHEIAAARRRQSQYWERMLQASSSSSSKNDSSDQKIIMDDLEPDGPTADATLLGGLASAMTFLEQEQITRGLCSGQTEELAHAAKLLYYISAKVTQRGKAPALGTTSSSASSWDISTTGTFHSMDQGDLAVETAGSSVLPILPEREFHVLYQLIEAGKRARYRAPPSPPLERPAASTTPHRPGSPLLQPPGYQKLANQKATQFRSVEREVRQQVAYVKRYPLPTRLPKYCECVLQFDETMNVGQIVKSLPFRFCNDVWDGTIMDAFAKVSIHNASFSPKLPRGKNYSGHPKITSTFVDNYKVQRRPPDEDEGVRNILQFASGEGVVVRGDDIPRPRVLIAAVVQPIGTVWPGDVVTHLNGAALGDTASVDDLMARIWSLCSAATPPMSSEGIPLQFVLNADRAVAEALRWRAVAQQRL